MTKEVASTGEQPTMHQSSEAQLAPAATRRCRLRNNSSIATEEFLKGESSPQEVRGVTWRLGSNWPFLSAEFALILLPQGKNHFSHFRPLYFVGDKCFISPLLSNAVLFETFEPNLPRSRGKRECVRRLLASNSIPWITMSSAWYSKQ